MLEFELDFFRIQGENGKKVDSLRRRDLKEVKVAGRGEARCN